MSSQTERQQAIEKLGELIGKIRVAMLTTVTEAGTLWSRPILTQRAKFDGDLWLVSKSDAPKTREVRLNSQVSLAFVKPDENIYVSVSGIAEIVDDSAKVEQLWDASYEGWFPEGPKIPNLALIRVSVERAEYWDAPSSTWRLGAGFVVMAPEQRDNPEFHARITLHGAEGKSP